MIGLIMKYLGVDEIVAKVISIGAVIGVVCLAIAGHIIERGMARRAEIAAARIEATNAERAAWQTKMAEEVARQTEAARVARDVAQAALRDLAARNADLEQQIQDIDHESSLSPDRDQPALDADGVRRLRSLGRRPPAP